MQGREVHELTSSMDQASDGDRFATTKPRNAHDATLLDQLLASLGPAAVRAALGRAGFRVRAGPIQKGRSASEPTKLRAQA